VCSFFFFFGFLLLPGNEYPIRSFSSWTESLDNETDLEYQMQDFDQQAGYYI
jgi:hypothetical protein